MEPTKEAIGTFTLIDHIEVNIDRNIIESGVFNLEFCDHFVVIAIRKFRGNIINDHKYVKTHKMKNFNEELFLRSYLMQIGNRT